MGSWRARTKTLSLRCGGFHVLPIGTNIPRLTPDRPPWASGSQSWKKTTSLSNTQQPRTVILVRQECVKKTCSNLLSQMRGSKLQVSTLRGKFDRVRIKMFKNLGCFEMSHSKPTKKTNKSRPDDITSKKR